MVRMPSRWRAVRVAWPTPQMIETGCAERKASVSERPISLSPRGLSRSEAILARNLLWERPTEAVMPSSASIRDCRRARRTTGGAWCRRSVPVRSRKASSRERGSTAGVSSSISDADGAGDLDVVLHAGADHHRVGAELERLEHRHGGTHAGQAGDVAGGGDDAAGAAADDDGLVGQGGVVALFHRGVERVAVEMGDGEGGKLGVGEGAGRPAGRAAAAGVGDGQAVAAEGRRGHGGRIAERTRRGERVTLCLRSPRAIVRVPHSGSPASMLEIRLIHPTGLTRA